MRNITADFSPLAPLLAASQTEATPIVLKDYSGTGYTFCSVPDTVISTYNPGKPISLALLALAGPGASRRR